MSDDTPRLLPDDPSAPLADRLLLALGIRPRHARQVGDEGAVKAAVGIRWRAHVEPMVKEDWASERQHREELEAIVRDLAGIEDPTVFDNDDTTPSFVCGVCRRGGPGDATRTATADHAESCPWRRARDLRKTP